MATIKISELPAILGANTATTDVLPLVDVSLNTTNKITRAEFFSNVGNLSGVGTITGATTLSLLTTTTSALTLDSGTTGAINIGTNANAKTITIGNGTGATSLVLNAGTGALNIGTNAIARTVTVGNATGASALALTAGTGGITLTGITRTTGVVYKNQAAENVETAAATLTIAELLIGIIQYTGVLATLTLPLGTAIEAGVPASFPVNMSFDFSVINTGSGVVTLGTATGLTLVGGMTVAVASSGLFRVRKTAASTYTVYRIS
jgi:hypothetical protein